MYRIGPALSYIISTEGTTNEPVPSRTAAREGLSWLSCGESTVSWRIAAENAKPPPLLCALLSRSPALKGTLVVLVMAIVVGRLLGGSDFLPRLSAMFNQFLGLVAIVQLRPGASAGEAELLAEAQKHVARYKLPKAFVFCAKIERSPSGKADYRWAREQVGAG